MANSEYNLTVVNGTALTISLSGPVGPAGAGGGGSTPAGFTLGQVQLRNSDGTALAADSGLVYTGTGNTGVLKIGGGSVIMSDPVTVENLVIGGGNPTLPLAARTTGIANTVIGSKSMIALTTGSGNFAIGSRSLAKLTTGDRNIAIGTATLPELITGTSNIGIGEQALLGVTTAFGNIAIGSGAGSNIVTGWNNISIAATPPDASSENSICIGTNGDGSNTTVIGKSVTTQTRLVGNNLILGHASTVAQRTTITQSASSTPKTITLPNATGTVPVYTDTPSEGQVLKATDASGASTWESLGTAATADKSTTGGANKIPQLDASGNWTTGPYDNDETTFGQAGNIYIPDKQGIVWMNQTGTSSGQGIYGWDNHGGAAGTPELIIQSPTRIAIIPNGGMQFGPNDPARYPRYIQMVSGYATSTAALNFMPSGALMFQTRAWDGLSAVLNTVSLQAHALDTTGENSILRIYDESDINIAGSTTTAGRGDITGNIIAEIYKDGIYSAGTAPSFVTLTSGATITQSCSKYKTVQAAKVTLNQATTLAITGAEAGMRGVIYVKQGAGAPWGFTLPINSATPSGLTISTGLSDIDRLQWEYDGSYYFWTITNNINIPIDADAAAFITRASITDDTQEAAINDFVTGLKSNSIWTKFHALYPFVGGNATAHSKNLIANTYNITNDGSADGLAWGLVTHNSSGIKGNDTTAYGNTTVVQSSIASSQDDFALYVYCKDITPTDGYFIGGSDTTRADLGKISGNVYSQGVSSSALAAVYAPVGATFRKHLVAQRDNSAGFELYMDALNFPATTASVGRCSSTLTLLARNRAIGVTDFTDATLGMAAISKSMTDAEWTIFRGLVTTFQTALGRANP